MKKSELKDSSNQELIDELERLKQQDSESHVRMREMDFVCDLYRTFIVELGLSNHFEQYADLNAENLWIQYQQVQNTLN
jgi:hypothetical protein